MQLREIQKPASRTVRLGLRGDTNAGRKAVASMGRGEVGRVGQLSPDLVFRWSCQKQIWKPRMCGRTSEKQSLGEKKTLE